MRSILLALLPACFGAALAQDATPPASPASAPQRIEITGGRNEDEARRRASVARTVIGRSQIEAFGDSSIGELLRRLPGVTTPGRRGGAPRLRGLGGGYTQLLIDGESIPRGFSLDSLTPEQVERIEILRAPTAETGARAIAGTINIVLREGFRKRLNDLRLGLGLEHGRRSPGVFWTHNDADGAFSHNLSGALFERRSLDRSILQTTLADDDGVLLERRLETSRSERWRRGLNASARLQWRLGEPGELLTISPSLFHADSRSESDSRLAQPLGTPPYDAAQVEGGQRSSALRLNGQWRQRLGEATRAEASGTLRDWRSSGRSDRDETGPAPRSTSERSRTVESGLQFGAKLSWLIDRDEARAGSEHSLVAGVEAELIRRRESDTLLEDGAERLGALGDTLQARSSRLALYAQNEWSPSPNWSGHAGLRWEGIATVGGLGDGERPRNRNGVWTPLLHALWKPEPASRSQLRMSLTRSWREPSLGSLIARPNPSSNLPLDGPNDATRPDRVGNPRLRPELATGVDLTWEHHPAGGGVFSVGLFQRHITDLMRRITRLQAVSWSPVPRWVARMENVGDAVTRGVELEAKGRLDPWRDGAPRVELRASLNLQDSKVDGVPGPHNRLEEQPRASANLGADWSPRGLPLKLGGSLSWVPAYETRIDADQQVQIGAKRVVDVYALWTLGPASALRLQAGNLLAPDSERSNSLRSADGIETTRSVEPSAIGWQLRLELKL